MILKRIFLLLGWFNESGPGDGRNAGGQTFVHLKYFLASINEAILVAALVDSRRQLKKILINTVRDQLPDFGVLDH